MEAIEQIKKFEDFLDREYKSNILKSIREGKKFLIIDFSDLLKNG